MVFVLIQKNLTLVVKVTREGREGDMHGSKRACSLVENRARHAYGEHASCL